MTFFACFYIGCGKDKVANPSLTVAVLEPYGKDSLALRKILDTNGLTHIPIGEPYVRNSVVINSVKKDTVKRIGEIRLIGKGITMLPKDIGQLSELTLLQLDSNAISSLPAELGNCKALTNLTLTYNKLTGLPPELGNLDSLHTLFLSHNTLTSLPDNIGNLKSLNNAEFDFNELSGLPASIGSLVNLIKLSLNNNKLTDLPATMTQLPRMYLIIGNNKLCTMSDDLKKWLDLADGGWDATQTCP